MTTTDPRAYVSLLAAARGDFSNEIIAETCPQPLALSDAPTLQIYMGSFMVESYRRAWAEADAAPYTGPAKPPASNLSVSTKKSSKPTKPPKVTKPKPPSEAALTRGWEITIFGLAANRSEMPMLGESHSRDEAQG
jgi:hypothetical protein